MVADGRDPPVPPLGRYLVRVLDVFPPRAPGPAARGGGEALVEFEFAVDGPDLAVTLLLPVPAFRDFCTRYGAEVTEATGRGEGRANLLGRDTGITQAAEGRHDGGEP
jgi:hypothetical protein